MLFAKCTFRARHKRDCPSCPEKTFLNIIHFPAQHEIFTFDTSSKPNEYLFIHYLACNSQKKTSSYILTFMQTFQTLASLLSVTKPVLQLHTSPIPHIILGIRGESPCCDVQKQVWKTKPKQPQGIEIQ